MSGSEPGKDSNATDAERRLSKALRLIEKLRNKCDFEKEVGQELALRNESLKKDLYNETVRHKHAAAAFDELYTSFFELWKQHELLLSSGVPVGPADLEAMRSALEDHRDTAERLKRFANPPSAKQKKKSRRASEVGINIQAELGTSLTRSRPGGAAEDVDSSRDGVPKISRKDTVLVASEGEAKTEMNGPAEAPLSRKSSLVLEGVGDLDYYSAENLMTPLFEHFIVVGVPAETASGVLSKMNRELEASEAASSRWLRKLGLSKMMSNENSPASSVGRSSNVTPERRVPDSPDGPGRESLWGVPSNLFSSAEEGDATSRATFSAPSSKPSTFSKFGKLFGGKESAPVESTDRGSFFGLKSRRQSTPAINPVDLELAVSEASIKRCDSAPAETDTSGIPTFSSTESAAEAEPSDADAPAPAAADEERPHGDVFNEDEHSALKPPVMSSPANGGADKNQFSSALSRFGFSKKKGETSSAPNSSNMSFGLSFGRLSSSSIAHDDSQDSTIMKRMPSVDEIASSFLFNDDTAPKTTSPKPGHPLSPKKAAPLVEFSEDLDPDIIYRYPPNVAPPPVEVADFCMPVGAKLFRINPREEETMALKILYSHEGHRSSRCFIFMLEDRTAAAGAGDEDESTARLYGICVIHHRLLCSQKVGANGGPVFEFITPVCYCFITRFPLFDFFFQVIWSMISGERILRMQGVQDHPDDEGYDRKSYSYVPEKTLSEILFALSKTKPPMFSERVVFSVPSASTVIDHMRLSPPGDMTEHDYNASSWALPCLLEWLSPRTLTWAIGLLLCEVKLIVIGHEPGMVSCAVMSLMSLLKPLTWVAPLIPILPLKHMDFIEAPVPIIAGVVLHGEAFSMTNLTSTPRHPHRDVPDPLLPTNPPAFQSGYGGEGPSVDGQESTGACKGEWHPETANMLKKCLDGDSLTAVLDLTVADIYVSKVQTKGAQECALPGMQTFLDSFQKGRDLTRSMSAAELMNTRGSPQYSVTPAMREDARSFQELLRTHLSDFVDSVESEFQKQMSPTSSTAIEEHVEKLKVGRDRVMSTTRTPFQDQPQHLQSFASFASTTDETSHQVTGKADAFGDEFSADVEEVTQSLADAVAAALKADSTVGAGAELHIDVTSKDDGDGIVGISSFPVLEDDQENRAAFLARFFQTQIFSEYMDELNLGMECLAENEGDDAVGTSQVDPGATLTAVRSGSISFLNDSSGVSKRHSFDAVAGNVLSSNAPVPSHKSMSVMTRPSSVEFTPSGAVKSGRKGRLSMYISGGIDTITGIPIPLGSDEDAAQTEKHIRSAEEGNKA